MVPSFLGYRLYQFPDSLYCTLSFYFTFTFYKIFKKRLLVYLPLLASYASVFRCIATLYLEVCLLWVQGHMQSIKLHTPYLAHCKSQFIICIWIYNEKNMKLMSVIWSLFKETYKNPFGSTHFYHEHFVLSVQERKMFCNEPKCILHHLNPGCSSRDCTVPKWVVEPHSFRALKHKHTHAMVFSYPSLDLYQIFFFVFS